MIIRQTTTIVFEYPQDYLQEQEWCKTKGERWIHKSTSTLGAVYENTISYSIGQPNSSEKPNNCEKTDCDTCRYAGECDWEPWQECPYEPKTEPTISKMEQVDKDINVRSKDEPQIQLTARCLNCNNAKACKEKHWESCLYEPKDEKTCETCRHWKYIAHEWQCEACKCQGYEPKDEPQTCDDCIWNVCNYNKAFEDEPQTDCAWK